MAYVSEIVVMDRAFPSIEDEKTGICSFLRRILRDKMGR
jgi:hypothetical protein